MTKPLYEFYHHYNSDKLKFVEKIYRTRLEPEAIRIARAYVNSFENTDKSYYSMTVDGYPKNIKELAKRNVCMESSLRDLRR